jgi:hypothetical protein
VHSGHRQLHFEDKRCYVVTHSKASRDKLPPLPLRVSQDFPLPPLNNQLSHKEEFPMPWNQVPKQDRPPPRLKAHVPTTPIPRPKTLRPPKPPEIEGWTWRWEK